MHMAHHRVCGHEVESRVAVRVCLAESHSGGGLSEVVMGALCRVG